MLPVNQGEKDVPVEPGCGVGGPGGPGGGNFRLVCGDYCIN